MEYYKRTIILCIIYTEDCFTCFIQKSAVSTQCDNITFWTLPSALRVILYPTMQRSQLDFPFAVTNAQELIRQTFCTKLGKKFKKTEMITGHPSHNEVMWECSALLLYYMLMAAYCFWQNAVYVGFYPKWQIRKIQAESTNPRDDTGIPNAWVELVCHPERSPDALAKETSFPQQFPFSFYSWKWFGWETINIWKLSHRRLPVLMTLMSLSKWTIRERLHCVSGGNRQTCRRLLYLWLLVRMYLCL